MKQQQKGAGRMVYSRLETGGADVRASARQSARLTSPTLLPLIVGFLLLLVVVLALGVKSVSELNIVSEQVLSLQRTRATQLGVLLNLRIALTELNSAALARDARQARREIAPLFSLRLNNTRAEAETIIKRIESAPFITTEEGQAFLRDLRAFIETTRSVDQYREVGEESFRRIDEQLDGFLNAANRQQENILRQAEELQSAAERRIYRLILLAVLTGLIVAAVTVWEVQRRFRQVRQSLLEARRERAFSTQVLEGMVSAVATVDAANRIRSANAAFFALFPEASIGASVYDFAAKSDEAKLLETITAERVTSATYRGRHLLRSAARDGEAADRRTFDAYVAPLLIDEERGLILTLVDVTEAVAAEEAARRREALAAVGEATAQVAHEIKNPLGSIRLGVSLLRDMNKDSEARHTIDLIERGIDHLNKLTVDVTQYARARPLDLAPTNINQLLDESLELVRDKFDEKRITVERKFGFDAGDGELDADQLRQVFVNLLANAVDASLESAAPIIITTERIESPGKTDKAATGNGHEALARITITDSGSGMNAEARARLFEPFYTTKKRGTGLGLAITKKIVEQHGGRIDVESEEGKGTSFVVELPLEGSGQQAVSSKEG